MALALSVNALALQAPIVSRTTTIDTLSPMPFDPQVGDVVKFYNEFAGDGGTTYTATIVSIDERDDGEMIYSVDYYEHVDEFNHTETL